LNFQLAVELERAGVKVVAIVEEARAPSAMTWRAAGRALFHAPRLMMRGASWLSALLRRGVPVLWQSRVVAAEGDTRFAAAIVETPAGRRRLAADVLALNAGFVPSSELARQLGCRHAFVDRHVGYLATETDESGRTSSDSVFAIGDGTRIGGAVVARHRAVLAAHAILRDLDREGLPARAVASARSALGRALAFQDALWTLFSAPAFDAGAIADSVVICRCETVTTGSLRAVLAAYGADCGTAKRLTRIGMGRCQGRNCAGVLTRLVAEAGGAKPQPAAFFAPRPPARLVPIAALAMEQAEWGGHRQWSPPLAFPHPLREPRGWGEREADVLVIGAGIVGACVARALARQGAAVLVVDRNALAQEASTSNAGSLHVQLLSFDFGPKAQAGGWPAAETLRLGPPSIALWRQIEQQAREDLEMHVTGGLMVAEDENDLKFLAEKATLEARYGVGTEIVQAADLRRLEPALSDQLIGAAHCPAEGKINPLKATFAVIRQALAAGATFARDAPVQAIERDADGLFVVTTGAGRIRARRIVNCAGPWSSQISAMVAKPLPVQCAPLQMMVTEPAPPLVGRLIAHASRHLSLKQTSVGTLLIGGGWSADLDEPTGAGRPLRWAIEGNAWVARRVLPAVDNHHLVRVWTGMNINIDGAPIVGEMPGVQGFFNCVTSSGYTLAPIVADITADLMLRGRCEFDLAPFRVERF
jgi:glycine/D-amino acid oxidase-like deaminating enzyme